MAAAEGSDGRKVIIDAGAAIKLQRLDRLGSELFTTSGVLAEVRDEHARALLGTLPQELQIKEPLPQDRAFVQQFAKATGDFGFLSQNDMDLIALTLRLHREAGGTVRDKPAALTHEDGGTATFDWAPARADKTPDASQAASDTGSQAVGAAAAESDWIPAGSGRRAFAPAARTAAAVTEADAEAEAADAKAEEVEANEEAPADTSAQMEADIEDEWVSVSRGSKGRRGAARAARSSNPAPAVSRNQDGAAAASSGSTAVPEGAAVRDLSVAAAASPAEVAAAVAAAEAAAEDEVELGEEAACATGGDAEQGPGDRDEPEDLDSEEDGSSAGEWVTPDNMHRFGVGVELDAAVRVTCATSDYSVQNVLLQMGITPLTFDGYAVRSVKLWGLVCRACFFFTRESQKIFCPKCGHDTLVRVPIVVDADGRPVALNSGRKLRTKGTVFSMPKPQQGRTWKPILAEDELKIGGRDREMRRLENLHNKEKQARDPFNEDNGARAWYQRGTTSTGKQLGSNAPRVQAGWGRRNPNANNFGGFRKKR
mmetsp:Transcript_14564/g.37045  ORF Transcript_14564/g.37045 Transcript_14564/m.37045 type:complete len:540 (+) Transcript_14564:47-1666(+)